MNEAPARQSHEALRITIDRLTWGLERMLSVSPGEIDRHGKYLPAEVAIRWAVANHRGLRARRIVRRNRITGKYTTVRA